MSINAEFWDTYEDWNQNVDYPFTADQMMSIDNEDCCFLSYRDKMRVIAFQSKETKEVEDIIFSDDVVTSVIKRKGE